MEVEYNNKMIFYMKAMYNK